MRESEWLNIERNVYCIHNQLARFNVTLNVRCLWRSTVHWDQYTHFFSFHFRFSKLTSILEVNRQLCGKRPKSLTNHISPNFIWVLNQVLTTFSTYVMSTNSRLSSMAFCALTVVLIASTLSFDMTVVHPKRKQHNEAYESNEAIENSAAFERTQRTPTVSFNLAFYSWTY